jgi:hypothetical protein
MPDLRIVRCYLLSRPIFIAVFVAWFLSLRVSAQKLVTTDSLLNTGTALTTTYNAPGTNGINGVVHPVGNGSPSLWNMYDNPWGVTTGSGTIVQNYSGSGAITTTMSLTGLPGSGVDGSPFVLYGCDQYYGSTHTCWQSQPPQFPKQLSAMSSLVIDFNYALSGTLSGTRNIDVIFDNWVCKTNQPTQIPDCLEVILNPYYNFAPGGWTYYKTINEPATINGASGTWSLDEYYWGAGSLLIAPHSLPGPTSEALRFNLLDILNKAAADYKVIFSDNTSYSWLMGIELGTEFGGNSAQSYTLTLSKLDVEQTLSGGPPAPTNLTAIVH